MTDVTDKYYREGTKLAHDKQYGNAILKFDDLLKIDPLDDRTWVAKGVCHTHLKEYQEAYQSFGEALKINPNNKRAADNQGVVSQYIDQYVPDEIPMPLPSSNPSPGKPSRVYSASWFLLLWPLIVIVGWIFFVPSMNIFTAFFLLPFGLFMTVLLSGIFIGIDAAGIEAGKGQPSEMSNSLSWKPAEWGLLTFLFLIIFYPFYLIKRKAIWENQYGGGFVKKSTSGVSPVIGILLILVLCVIGIPFLYGMATNVSDTHKTQAVVSSNPTPTYTSSSPRTAITTVIPTTKANPRWGDLEVTEYHNEMNDYGWGYISGTVKNLGSRSYGSVIITANLYDSDGALLGNSMDIVSNLEPYGTWKFNIPVILKGVDKYRITDITAY